MSKFIKQSQNISLSGNVQIKGNTYYVEFKVNIIKK